MYFRRTRNEPIYKPTAIKPELLFDGMRSDYVSLMRARTQPVSVASFVEKVSTLERLKQKSLNLNPPLGLLEDLEDLPPHIAEICERVRESEDFKCRGSSYDLSTFQSILIPTCTEDVRMDPGLIEVGVVPTCSYVHFNT
jgi:hypothetical protein